jgi:hypothetical protein
LDFQTIGNHWGKYGFKLTDPMKNPEEAMEMILNGGKENSQTPKI